jgi:hypothetical protein
MELLTVMNFHQQIIGFIVTRADGKAYIKDILR